MNSQDFTRTVLSNALIFDIINDFLPLEDLKQLRLVCRKWKDISEAAFKKRVRICFDFDPSNREWTHLYIKYYKSSFTKYPAPKDLNAFFKRFQKTHPYTAVRFSNLLPWSNPALTRFFKTQGKHITDLVLHEVALKNNRDTVNGHKMSTDGGYHFNSIFGGIVNLKKLKVRCYADSSTRFALTLHDLAKIQCIRLGYCIVVLTDCHCRISPIELELDDPTFVQGGTFVDSVLLNDFVTFTLMEKLTATACVDEWNCKTTLVKLNLFGSENIKFVKVDYLDSWWEDDRFEGIVDFKDSSWEIETLDLCAIPFQQMNSMIVRDLCINCIPFSPHNFPKSIQKLQLFDLVEFPENLSWNFSLPKLKILGLTGTNTINSVFPHLLNSFPNLVELKLKSNQYSNGIVQIDINLIPIHVQKMLFYGTDFDFVGDGVRAVQMLFLRNSELSFAMKVCKHFIPNNLVVFVTTKKLKVGVDDSFFIALKEICGQAIIFGLLDCDNNRGNKDDFVFPSGNKPGEFYSYLNGKGDVTKFQHGERNESPLKCAQRMSQAQ